MSFDNSLNIIYEKTKGKRYCVCCKETFPKGIMMVKNVVSSWCTHCWSLYILNTIEDSLLSEAGLEVKRKGKELIIANKV